MIREMGSPHDKGGECASNGSKPSNNQRLPNMVVYKSFCLFVMFRFKEKVATIRMYPGKPIFSSNEVAEGVADDCA